uniref:CBS domain-containing protein n=1 Tax=Chromera velia CCMP2878 TaxID=1169474 RepID=A0A0G4HGC4_9ALVE|eukprot:Cvel_27169.t1-p1 / transcript=Cvel_27169.t1 / gene=Cvel_27169 / organism=Chromera_velia_CCMP2878 / gene_product=hypothetical protein / transcript_product=hypothetical protein / location=Cvel_scaffold3347:7352-11985(-) / protein_length=363 / sequence_SO=supercontig / SO=protein_coding / is_pseudo=false
MTTTSETLAKTRIQSLLEAPVSEVLDWLEPQETLIVSAEDSLLASCRSLHERGLRSCLIEGGAGGRHSILDMRDVNSLLVETIGVSEPPSASAPLSVEPSNPLSPQDLVKKLEGVKASQVANKSGKNHPVPFLASQPVKALIKNFSQGTRVPIVTSTDGAPTMTAGTGVRLLRVFSPVDLLSVMKKGNYLEDLQSTRDVPMTVALGQKPVSCITDEDSLFKAMYLLYKTGFSAMPIVDSSNPLHVISVLSVRDLKHLLLPDLLYLSPKCLTEPAMDFLTAVKRFEEKGRFPFMNVREDSSLQAAVAKLLAASVQRILLTDSRGQLSGVVSITDICRLLAELGSRAQSSASKEQEGEPPGGEMV